MPKPEVLAHFEQHDPVLFKILQDSSIEPLLLHPHESFFQKVAESIISQQLSVGAARVIRERFHLLLENQITPSQILAVPDEELRAVGLSWAKVRYIKDLAEKTQNGDIQFSNLAHLPDESVIEHLTQVKGVGRWTAEMFLLFTLGREDIFSLGDLGLKRGIQKLYFLEDTPDFHLQAAPIVEKWQPYRSYASLALWRSLDNKPV